LESTTFHQLLAATAISDIGIFMRVTGTAWLMLSFGAGPMYVALIQTASSLPFFLLALPAGSIGDIVDRRKLILVTELWMMSASVALAFMTIAGIVSPWALILLTFAISVATLSKRRRGARLFPKW
jgi:MFS family permease